VKFLQFARRRFQFQLAPREREILFQLLQNYPLIPQGYHKSSLSLEPEQSEPTDELLTEALEGRRAENRAAIMRMLKARGRFRREGNQLRFSLTRDELEWLLQVLNDLRVGCWLALGQPDDLHLRHPELTEESLRFWTVMRVCDGFEYVFLRAVEAGE
jgi:hypothetical protein